MVRYHDDEYIKLVKDVLTNGVRKPNRTGTDTFAVFSRQLRFDLSGGSVPLLTTKKMHTRSIIHELLWYLRGESNIKYLQDNGVRIWNEWADENGDLGPVYGYQWRHWPTFTWTDDSFGDEEGHCGYYEPGEVDQIADLIHKLRNNPTDRRLIISAWNVGQLQDMALPPCHYTFQFYTRPLPVAERETWFLKNVPDADYDCPMSVDEKHKYLDRHSVPKYALSLMLNQRSCDVGLGVPFNIIQYSILLHMVAQVTNMVSEEFIWNGGDVHVYENHIEQLNGQVRIEPYPSPRLKLNPNITELEDFTYEDFEIVDYNHHPLIKMEVSV